MSLLGRASRRFLLRHPGQLALTLLGVALGVAVVVSIDLAILSSRAAFAASTETVAGRATHAIEGGAARLPDDLLARVRREAGVRASAPVVEAYAMTRALPGRALRLLGIDPFSERPFRPWLGLGGPDFDLTRLITDAGGVVVAAEVAAEAGWRVDDPVDLIVEGRRVTATLVGVIGEGGDLGGEALRDLMITDIATAQRFLARPRLDRIDLRLPEGAPGEEAAARVRALLPGGATLAPAGARAEEMAGMLGAFDLNLTALSLLALVFGVFLIYNAMTFSVVQRRELFGGLRAIGVTRRELFGMVISEAAWTGVVGTVLGLALGVALGRGLVGLVTRTINDLYFVVSVESVTVTPILLLKGGVLGVGATLLAALPAVREAVLAPPRTSMVRSLGEARARDLVPRLGWAGVAVSLAGVALLLLPTRSLVVGFVGLACVVLGIAALAPVSTVVAARLLTPLLGRTVGILGTMASRGVVAALSRTAPAIAALVVAVSVTVGLGVMIASFRATLIDWLDYTLQADIYVAPPSAVASRSAGTLPPELVQRMSDTPGVAGVSTLRAAEVPSEYGELRIVALDLDPRGEAAYRFRAGDPATAFARFRAGEALLVSEPFAYRHGLGVGDRVRIPGAEGVELPIAAVFTDFGSDQGVVLMGRVVWDRLFDDAGVTSLGIFLAEGARTREVIAALEATVGADQAVFINSNRRLREGSLVVFDRTFAITGVLRALAFVVAFIGVISALMALQLERARELGVLRANGLTPRQVWGLVTAQTGLMGVVAGVLAIPAGLALAVVMIFVVNKRSFGWTLEMTVGPELLVQSVALAVLAALAAGIWPAWRMSRTSPAVALRNE
ncbi:MAG: ABC transporter permease [Longimicrobiales bacterium]|nr:ABC transporter permease [Longimicrobiales bacterium]